VDDDDKELAPDLEPEDDVGYVDGFHERTPPLPRGRIKRVVLFLGICGLAGVAIWWGAPRLLAPDIPSLPSPPPVDPSAQKFAEQAGITPPPPADGGRVSKDVAPQKDFPSAKEGPPGKDEPSGKDTPSKKTEVAKKDPVRLKAADLRARLGVNPADGDKEL